MCYIKFYSSKSVGTSATELLKTYLLFLCHHQPQSYANKKYLKASVYPLQLGCQTLHCKTRNGSHPEFGLTLLSPIA